MKTIPDSLQPFAHDGDLDSAILTMTCFLARAEPPADIATLVNLPQEKTLCTPLQDAAMNGHVDMMELLIGYGADLNARCADGMTPLMYAVIGESTEAVKFLLQLGAQVTLEDNDGFTVFHMANVSPNKDIRDLMLQSAQEGKSPSNSQRNIMGCSPLHYAAFNGHGSIMNMLLRNGHDINGLCERGMTPLMYAVMSDKEDTVQSLLKKGAQVSINDKNGFTAGKIASAQGNKKIAMMILMHTHKIHVQSYMFPPAKSDNGKENGKKQLASRIPPHLRTKDPARVSSQCPPHLRKAPGASI